MAEADLAVAVLTCYFGTAGPVFNFSEADRFGGGDLEEAYFFLSGGDSVLALGGHICSTAAVFAHAVFIWL